MKRDNKLPQTLIEAVRYFSDVDRCIEFMANLRWADGKAECPRCGHGETYYLAKRRVWKCKGCSKQFSIKVGTVMEDSPITLDKWLSAMWMIVNAKNGISSYEIHRAVGVTQRSAWFLLHRIRLAMQQGTFNKLGGEVEVDETVIGGLSRNMHLSKRKHLGTGGMGKVAVMGLLERHGEVRARVVPNVRRETLQPAVRENVEQGAQLYTDAWVAYTGLDAEYVHEVINHSERYVRGRVHTNGIENFWSLLKRCIKGTYVSVEPFHLFRYLDEQTFRFNSRKVTDAMRFTEAVRLIVGKRLEYKKLIGQPT
jgi:transposase-like protein